MGAQHLPIFDTPTAAAGQLPTLPTEGSQTASTA